jgi:fluoride exporter
VTRGRLPAPDLVAAVAVGGAAGALLRWRLTTAFPDHTAAFPWTTFAVNVTGCLVLAALPALSVVRRNRVLPPLLGTGVLGGYTTLSTYAEQARALLASGQVATAAAYVVGTLAACLLAVVLADRFSTLVQRREFEAEEGDL